MTSQEWLAYLTTPEAHITQQGILDYGDCIAELQTTQTQNILCDLSHVGTLEVNGDDASTFLQGQLTNDIRLVDDHHAQISGYCNPKGRLLALFTITGANNQYQLLMPYTILPSIQKRLSMFVMRSKVKIADISENTFILGLHGTEAESIVSKIIDRIPQIPYETVISDKTRVIRLPTSLAPRFLIIIEGDQVQSIWERLKQDCHIVGKSCWDYLDIHAGLPTIVEETQEEFVPQMLNLDILNGINFKKGCYTGQEIVARTHYLGNIKRRTFLATLHHQNAPIPGSFITDGQNNQVGQVVSAVPSLDGIDMLVELRLEAAQAGALFYESFPLELRDLPYSLDKAGS